MHYIVDAIINLEDLVYKLSVGGSSPDRTTEFLHCLGDSRKNLRSTLVEHQPSSTIANRRQLAPAPKPARMAHLGP